MRRRITILPGPGSVVQTPGYANGFSPEFVVTGDFEYQVEDLDYYVNVQLIGSGSHYEWTYRDPSGQLDVGDLVEVPHGYRNNPWTAKVVSLGKGYDGPYPIKDVTARLERQAL